MVNKKCSSSDDIYSLFSKIKKDVGYVEEINRLNKTKYSNWSNFAKYEMRNISKLIKINKKIELAVVNNSVIIAKLKLLDKIISTQTKLVVILQQLFFVKSYIGYSYQENKFIAIGLLRNYQVLKSIVDLLRKGMYGSARSLLRQSLELLLISKFNFINNDLYTKWINKKESGAKNRDNKNEINLSSDILNKLINSGVKCNKIKELYRIFCDFNHATIYSQQPPFLILKLYDLESIKIFYWNEYMTLDYVFLLLNMNFHLINLFYNQTKFWIVNNKSDVFGYKNLVSSIKLELKQFFKLYYPTDKKYLKVTKNTISESIKEFKSNWRL